jgi:hypothetical protein
MSDATKLFENDGRLWHLTAITSRADDVGSSV